MKVWAVLLAVVAMVAAGPLAAGEVEDTADRFAETVSNSEGLHCVANHGSRTIICLAMLSDQDTDRDCLVPNHVGAQSEPAASWLVAHAGEPE